MEDYVRLVVDSFNRFRRPDAEARIVKIESNAIIMEITGSEEHIDGYIKGLKEDLCSFIGETTIEIVKKNGICTVKFLIHNHAVEIDDPMKMALKIVDRYYEGTPAEKFAIED